MPSAAFICPAMHRRKRSFQRRPSSEARTRRARQRVRRTQPFQMRRFAQDCGPQTYSCTSSGRKDAQIAHIKRCVPGSRPKADIAKRSAGRWANRRRSFDKACKIRPEVNASFLPMKEYEELSWISILLNKL